MKSRVGAGVIFQKEWSKGLLSEAFNVVQNFVPNQIYKINHGPVTKVFVEQPGYTRSVKYQGLERYPSLVDLCHINSCF